MKDFNYYLTLMKSRVSNLDTATGSVADGLLRAAAFGFAEAEQALQAYAQICFPEDGSGEYLDARAADVGLTRKPGTIARGSVTFAGTEGTEIPAGTAVQTAGGLVYLTDADAEIDSTGQAVVTVDAEQPGAAYNVAAGQITSVQSGSLPIIVTSSSACTGGADAEPDASLLARLQTFLRQPSASGNAAQYVAWATSVPGVGFARVIPRPGGVAYAVKLVLADEDMLPVSAAVAANCAAYIETVREVCVDVTVVPATSAPIDVAAQIVLSENVDASDVAARFSAALQSYLAQLVRTGGDVIYQKVAALLIETEGVENFSNLTVNESVVDVEIDIDEVPVVGTVALEAVN